MALRLRYLLMVASVLALAAPALAAGCAEWNTEAFFESATSETVTDCLAAGASVNSRNGRGVTPLHYAAWHSDSPAVISVLIAAGADVNAQDEEGETPLHSAARWNDNPAVIEALLDAGANASVRNRAGKIPWDYARYESELEGSDAIQQTACAYADAGMCEVEHIKILLPLCLVG